MEDAAATGPMTEAWGECECAMDGAKVNTIEGWREIRAVVMCRCEPGQPAGVRHGKKRKLPEPSARVVWAGIADHQAVGQQPMGPILGPPRILSRLNPTNLDDTRLTMALLAPTLWLTSVV